MTPRPCLLAWTSCPDGHFECEVCFTRKLPEACAGGGRAAEELVCAHTGRIYAATELPCSLFAMIIDAAPVEPVRNRR